MKYFSKALLSVVFAICVVQLSHAHRFYAAFTQIDLREKKQTIEIVHRLFTHDVEDYLRLKLGNASALSDAEIEPILRNYVEQHFALSDGAGNRLPLNWIAMEYEVDSVHIYQETPLPKNHGDFILINSLLMDLFPEQKNTVNVEWGEQIRTRIFLKGQEQQKVSFPVVP